MAHVIVLQVRETLPHEAGIVRFSANQGGTAKFSPFVPSGTTVIYCRLKTKGVIYFQKDKSDEEKKMRRLLCPESKGNAGTFAIIPLYDVVSELLIESRTKNFWFDE